MDLILPDPIRGHVVAFWSWNLDVLAFWSWNLDVVVFWSWNLDVVFFWSWNLDVVVLALLHFRTPPIVIDDSHEKTRLKALP